MQRFAMSISSLLLTIMLVAQATPPELAVWQLNTTGQTGYNGYIVNVQQVRYSPNNVYVNSTGIATYMNGSWSNPGSPTQQSYQFRIPRAPASAGTKLKTPLSQIGLLSNGVPIYNMLNSRSYNNFKIWNENALLIELPSLDTCNGHHNQEGKYHHHHAPKCLYPNDPTTHSPLLGYAFDGYPIYGPYAYANADGTGAITRMTSSYRTRTMTQRTSLPDGTVLAQEHHGPSVSGQYPLGYYAEDFEYVAGLGVLDAHNGRFSVTPEYPGGTYAYFVTIDGNGNGVFPYLIGPQFYGMVDTANLGPVTTVPITETVVAYPPLTYTLSVATSGTGGGKVVSDPAGIDCGADCSDTYDEGTVIELLAVPNVGSTFTGWSGACSGTSNCLVTMSQARSATANFTLNSYTLTIIADGAGVGTITSSPSGISCGGDCSEVFSHGTAITLTATPSENSAFDGWSGACDGTGSCVITMDQARSVTATFTSQNASIEHPLFVPLLFR